MTTHGVKAIVGLSGFRGISGSFAITRDRTTQLELPERFTEDHLRRIRRDLEILHKMTEDHPKAFLDLQNAVLKFDFHRANELAKEIGLDEHRIMSEGGGLNWVIVIIAIACAVGLSSDSGPSSGSGGGDAGGGDAGGGDADGGAAPGGHDRE